MSKKAGKAPWIVILGAGFGGLSVAAELNDYLEKNPDSIRVVLVEKNYNFIFDTANQFALAGRTRIEHLTVSYLNHQLNNIFFIQDEVLSVDTETRQVIARGHKFKYAKLVVALGTDKDTARIPGLGKGAFDMSSMSDVSQLKDALAYFRGGDIVVAVPEWPHAGVTRPYEIAMLLQSLVTHKMEKEIAQNTHIILSTPSLTAVPEAKPDVVRTLLDERKVEFLTDHRPIFVDPVKRNVVYSNGSTLKYDILVSQLPRKSHDFLVEAGLAKEGGLVEAHPYTCRTATPNVYCIGGCADMKLGDMSVPVGGPFSVSQGSTVAADIIRSVENKGSDEDEKWNMASGEMQSSPVTMIAESGSSEAIQLVYNIFHPGEEDRARERSPDSYDVSLPQKEKMNDLIAWWDKLVCKWFTVQQGQQGQ